MQGAANSRRKHGQRCCTAEHWNGNDIWRADTDTEHDVGILPTSVVCFCSPQPNMQVTARNQQLLLATHTHIYTHTQTGCTRLVDQPHNGSLGRPAVDVFILTSLSLCVDDNRLYFRRACQMRAFYIRFVLPFHRYVHYFCYCTLICEAVVCRYCPLFNTDVCSMHTALLTLPWAVSI